jgi:calcitonin receptor-like
MVYMGINYVIYRDLSRQHRIRLHINFFISLLMRSVTVILWFMMVHHEKLTNAEVNDAVMIRNPVNLTCLR